MLNKYLKNMGFKGHQIIGMHGAPTCLVSRSEPVCDVRSSNITGRGGGLLWYDAHV
jgi:hypothetical protein